MLERTIAEIRGDEVEDETSVSINLGVDVSIPKDYIIEAAQRLRTYKRIAAAESDEALSQIRSEIEDRYGRLPQSVDSLIAYGRLRRLAEEMRIASVDKTSDGIALKFTENARVSPEALMQMVSESDAVSFSPNGILRIPADSDELLNTAMNILAAIKA
jgi:transcription-repair coupling factor (superfamily II helicase)